MSSSKAAPPTSIASLENWRSCPQRVCGGHLSNIAPQLLTHSELSLRSDNLILSLLLDHRPHGLVLKGLRASSSPALTLKASFRSSAQCPVSSLCWIVGLLGKQESFLLSTTVTRAQGTTAVWAAAFSVIPSCCKLPYSFRPCKPSFPLLDSVS